MFPGRTRPRSCLFSSIRRTLVSIETSSSLIGLTNMHFIYIDDSSDRPTHVFSAICVPCDRWNDVFERLRQWRSHLRETHKIPINHELHAQEFLSGRGSADAFKDLPRHRRAQIFYLSMKVTNWLNECGVTVFNVCTTNDNQFQAFERLLNRINRTMEARKTQAHLICDQGKELQYTRLVRKMKAHNYIPSKYGRWNSGEPAKNIPIDRIIEDPQFKNSKSSYLIQQADFISYALLRRERPTPRIKKHGIHKHFDVLDGCLEKVCNRHDPKGVIR
jgi:hypothetical protein